VGFTEAGIEVENGKKCVDRIDRGFSRSGNGFQNVNMPRYIVYEII
jgi:hypothetical protein